MTDNNGNKSIFDEKTIIDYYGLDKVKEIERKNPLAYEFLISNGICCVYRDILDFTSEKGERLVNLLGKEVVDKIREYDKNEDDCWYEVLSTHFAE